MSHGTIVLNKESLEAYKELLQNPGDHGLPFRPIKDCFKPAEVAKPKHLLFKEFQAEVSQCPKVVFYLVMDELYKDTIDKAPSGEMGYKLEFIKL